MQLDRVTLGGDRHPHPFTIGSQQDRFGPAPILVSNHHPHCSSTSLCLSWRCSRAAHKYVDLFGYGPEVLRDDDPKEAATLRWKFSPLKRAVAVGVKGQMNTEAEMLTLRRELHSLAAGDRAGLRYPVTLRRTSAAKSRDSELRLSSAISSGRSGSPSERALASIRLWRVGHLTRSAVSSPSPMSPMVTLNFSSSPTTLPL